MSLMSSWPLRIALAISLTAAASAAHAGAPVAVTGGSWSGPAELKAKISARKMKAQSVRGPVTFDAFFGPFALPALAGNQFLLVLDDGSDTIDVEGSYTLDAEGRPVLDVDRPKLEAFLRVLFGDVCAQVPGCGSLSPLVITQSEVGVKAGTDKRGIESFSSKGRIDFEFRDGDKTFVRAKLGFKGGSGITRD